MCVLQTFGNPAQDVGYFCFWKRGDSAPGAPTLCSSEVPYVRTIADASSIDAQMATICGLAASTCVARAQFRSTDCTSGASGDDSLCGFAPPDDAVCEQFDEGVHRCTMRCLSDDDCPGVSCNTQVGEPYCLLNTDDPLP